MTTQTAIATRDEIAGLRAVAAVLLPGDGTAPPAVALPDLDANLTRALAAVGREAPVVLRAVTGLPDPLDWDTLRDWSAANAEQFEALATVVAGAYFMAPEALDAIGYPHGPRRRAPHDQAVEELGSGLLDPVLDRGPTVREVAAS
jgi:hypothetical protein